MKKTFFIIMILGFAVISFTNPIGELFKSALNSNKGIKMTMLNFESAQMEYEKALIESSNKKALLSAELSMLNERSSYRKGQADATSAEPVPKSRVPLRLRHQKSLDQSPISRTKHPAARSHLHSLALVPRDKIER